jgi:hypothetical protein
LSLLSFVAAAAAAAGYWEQQQHIMQFVLLQRWLHFHPSWIATTTVYACSMLMVRASLKSINGNLQSIH